MVRIGCETTDCPDIMKPVESALHVRGLTKRFDRLAVDTLDLTVQSGEFYALVGPNGAGKTTTLRMVAGLLAARRRLGRGARYRRAQRSGRGQANDGLGLRRTHDLRQADAAGISRIRRRALGRRSGGVANPLRSDLLVSLGLEPHLHERCEGFSKGMRQKVALAGALGTRSAADHSRRTAHRP